MSNEAVTLTGGCMCGAVRYETAGEALNVINCHCRSCRKHTGAPGATLAVYKASQVEFSGEDRKIYDSSPGVGRGFCARCGTPLSWETGLGALGRVTALHISGFDTPDALKPRAHSFYTEKISWFDFADQLPRYEGFVKDGKLLGHGPRTAEPAD